jgi:magnesium-protoporphyrin IX monomethyl ester (oxidative) cyclase
MTRILFIDANRYWDAMREFETMTDHPGLLYLYSYLRQEFGPNYFDIKIIYRDIEQSLATFKPDVVGISSVTQNFNIAKRYAKLAKSAGCSVVVGGAHISAMPESLSVSMDVGVVGEGEETIVELMKLYEREKTFANKELLRQVQGIVYSHNGKYIQTEPRPLIAPLDKIPFPARDLSYINRVAGIFTSRGCPYKCRFCFTTHHWKKVRLFSPGYVLKEIKELIEKYHVKQIGILDDLFISNKKRLTEIVELLKKEKIPEIVSFTCNVRADHVDDTTVSLLKEMNVKEVFMGAESGVQRTLTYLKGDNITVEQNKIAIDILKGYGIWCAAGIIIGSPTETKEEILGTLQFVKESKLDKFYVFTLTPLPGTPVWDYALERGMVSNDMDWDKLRMEFSEIPDKAIVLSEVLTRDELFKLYRLFEKEKVIRDFKDLRTRSLRELGDVIRHPMLFFKKLPRAVRGRYISNIIAIFYRRIKLRSLSFRSENENSK